MKAARQGRELWHGGASPTPQQCVSIAAGASLLRVAALGVAPDNGDEMQASYESDKKLIQNEIMTKFGGND